VNDMTRTRPDSMEELGSDSSPPAWKHRGRDLEDLGLSPAEATSIRPPAAHLGPQALVPVARTTVSLGLVVKWAAAGVAAGTLLTGTAALVGRGRTAETLARVEPRALAPKAGRPSAVAQAPAARPSELGLLAAAPARVEGLPLRPQARRPTADAASSSIETGDCTLAAEIAVVELAQRALRARRPLAALEVLDDYDRRAGSSRLGPAATVVRIEAHLALGQTEVARQLGERLLAQRPDSALAERVRLLLKLPKAS
jgi:hypothetical protein